MSWVIPPKAPRGGLSSTTAGDYGFAYGVFEKVGGLTMKERLIRRILDPLKMESTMPGIGDERLQGLRARLVSPYRNDPASTETLKRQTATGTGELFASSGIASSARRLGAICQCSRHESSALGRRARGDDAACSIDRRHMSSVWCRLVRAGATSSRNLSGTTDTARRTLRCSCAFPAETYAGRARQFRPAVGQQLARRRRSPDFAGRHLLCEALCHRRRTAEFVSPDFDARPLRSYSVWTNCTKAVLRRFMMMRSLHRLWPATTSAGGTREKTRSGCRLVAVVA